MKVDIFCWLFSSFRKSGTDKVGMSWGRLCDVEEKEKIYVEAILVKLSGVIYGMCIVFTLFLIIEEWRMCASCCAYVIEVHDDNWLILFVCEGNKVRKALLAYSVAAKSFNGSTVCVCVYLPRCIYSVIAYTAALMWSCLIIYIYSAFSFVVHSLLPPHAFAIHSKYPYFPGESDAFSHCYGMYPSSIS